MFPVCSVASAEVQTCKHMDLSSGKLADTEWISEQPSTPAFGESVTSPTSGNLSNYKKPTCRKNIYRYFSFPSPAHIPHTPSQSGKGPLLHVGQASEAKVHCTLRRTGVEDNIHEYMVSCSHSTMLTLMDPLLSLSKALNDLSMASSRTKQAM